MKKQSICFSLLILLYHGISAQSLMYVRNGCAVNDAEMGQNHYVFVPSEEATQFIKTIMEANFLEPNFVIKSGDVENALATVEGSQRYIIYNTTYVERIKRSGGSDWPAFYVFAHEIGHHLNNHSFDLSNDAMSKEQELKADLFAGGMLYRLGATLDQAQVGIGDDFKESGSRTHPPRRARLEAIASGWKKAYDQSGGVQPKPVVISVTNKVDLLSSTSTPTTFTDPLVGTFRLVNGGTFEMGSDDGYIVQKPVHRVTLNDFFMGAYEVTVAQFKAYVDDTGYQTDAEKKGNSNIINGAGKWETKSGVHWRCDAQGNRRPSWEYNHPVIHVSWNDATSYALWVSRKTGDDYRLPTEAEWEYAAGNGTRHTKYGWGNGAPVNKRSGNVADETAKAKFSWSIFAGYTDGYVFTAPVGTFDANDLGLYDMTGNVWELCADWYGDYTPNSQINPTGPTSGISRVRRGGSWFFDPAFCRVEHRDHYYGPADHIGDVGFRLARTR